MIRYMQGTKFFRKPVICKSVIHKTVMDKDLLYLLKQQNLTTVLAYTKQPLYVNVCLTVYWNSDYRLRRPLYSNGCTVKLQL